MYKLDGRTAFITGGATGIGRSIAVRLAAEGCDIVIADINERDVATTAELVRKAGRKCSTYKVDVSSYDEASAAVQRCLGDFGKIDILINNAGIISIGRVEELSTEEWRRVFAVNLDGVFNFCKAVVPHMRKQKRGRIINTASWFGKSGKPSYSAYCASKFAVIGLTQSLAQEVAAEGITVNAVCPGTIVETGMRDEADRRSIAAGLKTAKEREDQIPMGRVGLPDDVARVVAFLASDESAYMTGQAINVTGGLWMG